MNIEDQSEINNLLRQAITEINQARDNLARACCVAVNKGAFTYASSLLSKCAMCDGLRAEVSVSVVLDQKAPLPSPVVSTGRESREVKA